MLAAGADVQRPGSCEQLDTARAPSIGPQRKHLNRKTRRSRAGRAAPVIFAKRNGLAARGSCSLSIRRARLGAPASQGIKDHWIAPSRKCRSERGWRRAAEALGEDFPPTMSDPADKPPGDHPEANLPAGGRQIGDLPCVSAMNSARYRAARRALGRVRRRPNGQNNRIRRITYALNNNQTTRHKRRSLNSGSHGADSPIGESQARQRTSRKLVSSLQ